jgi:hypothetical protein
VLIVDRRQQKTTDTHKKDHETTTKKGQKAKTRMTKTQESATHFSSLLKEQLAFGPIQTTASVDFL